MELKDRIQLILDEQHIKQKDLAQAIKVSEGYISNMVKGKRCNISEARALLIEQAYGYSAQWVLTGNGERYISQSKMPSLSPAKKRVIAEIEKMSEPELDAIKVFISSLDGYKKAFSAPDTGKAAFLKLATEQYDLEQEQALQASSVSESDAG